MSQTQTSSDYQKQNEDFVARVRERCRDRGTRAELRRYWSERTRHYAYPVLGALGAINDERRQLIAALYATHDRDNSPAHRIGGASVGAAFLHVAGGPKGGAYDSTERHFRRLLACQTLEELGDQLHRLVKRLERDSTPIDYAKLLGDLRQWHNNSDAVKTRWSLDFWQAKPDSDIDLV